MSGWTAFWPMMALAISAAAPLSCKPNEFPGPKGPPPDDSPPPTSAADRAPVRAVPSPAAVASASPTASAAPPPPIAAPPPPLPPTAALDAALEAGIKFLAAKHARGMQPDGPPISGELKQGEHLDTMVTFEPSKCYAVVGFSPANSIKNIKLRLLVGPLYGAAAAEGAIIGKGGPICPPSAMTYKLDVAALKGAGKIGAQVYSKAK